MGVTSTAASAPKLDPPFLRLQPAAPPSSTMATGSLSTDCANAISEQRNNGPNNRKFVALTKWSLAASNFKRAWIFQFKIQWTYKSPTRRNGRRLIACGVHSSRALRANIGIARGQGQPGQWPCARSSDFRFGGKFPESTFQPAPTRNFYGPLGVKLVVLPRLCDRVSRIAAGCVVDRKSVV